MVYDHIILSSWHNIGQIYHKNGFLNALQGELTDNWMKLNPLRTLCIFHMVVLQQREEYHKISTCELIAQGYKLSLSCYYLQQPREAYIS